MWRGKTTTSFFRIHNCIRYYVLCNSVLPCTAICTFTTCRSRPSNHGLSSVCIPFRASPWSRLSWDEKIERRSVKIYVTPRGHTKYHGRFIHAIDLVTHVYEHSYIQLWIYTLTKRNPNSTLGFSNWTNIYIYKKIKIFWVYNHTIFRYPQVETRQNLSNGLSRFLKSFCECPWLSVTSCSRSFINTFWEGTIDRWL